MSKRSRYRDAKRRAPATEKVRVGGEKPYAPKSLYRLDVGKERLNRVTESRAHRSQWEGRGKLERGVCTSDES